MEEQDMALETTETTEQTSDVGELWDGADEAVDQRPEEPEEGEEQTSEAPETEETVEDGPSGQDHQGDAPEENGQEGADEGSRSPASAQGQAQESFTLTVEGAPMTVGREEVIRLAQQGLDYDRIRQERDSLRSSAQESEGVLELVKGFAQRSGMTVPEYIDYCRVQELMGQGVNEATARSQLQIERQQAQLDKAAQQDAEAQAAAVERQRQAQARSQAQRRDMEAFLAAYPTVQAGEIPKEVWDRVAQGGSLLTEYTRWDNQRLRAQLAARESQEQAARMAPGSLGSRGQKGQKSAGDYWDEAGEL